MAFPRYRILGIFQRWHWQNELASISTMITQDGRVRFARSEVGSDRIQADAFGAFRTTLVWYP